MKSKAKKPAKSAQAAARTRAKPAAARKAVARTPAAAYRLTPTAAVVTLDVRKEGVEAVFGAAYLMIDKAYVALAGSHVKTLRVTLRPKNSKAPKPRALAEEFLADLESQKVRWALAKNNQPVREFVAEQAVLIASGAVQPPAPAAVAEPAAEQLTDDQRAEIEKLIAEVEDEIKTMNQKKTQSNPSAADPKNIKASWEEKQQQRGTAPE